MTTTNITITTPQGIYYGVYDNGFIKLVENIQERSE